MFYTGNHAVWQYISLFETGPIYMHLIKSALPLAKGRTCLEDLSFTSPSVSVSTVSVFSLYTLINTPTHLAGDIWGQNKRHQQLLLSRASVATLEYLKRKSPKGTEGHLLLPQQTLLQMTDRLARKHTHIHMHIQVKSTQALLSHQSCHSLLLLKTPSDDKIFLRSPADVLQNRLARRKFSVFSAHIRFIIMLTQKDKFILATAAATHVQPVWPLLQLKFSCRPQGFWP